MRVPSPKDKRATEICVELTITPIPYPFGGEKIRSEIEPKKKGGVGGGCFRFYVCFSLPYSDTIAINQVNFPNLSCFFPMRVTGE